MLHADALLLDNINQVTQGYFTMSLLPSHKENMMNDMGLIQF
jgi:hypothetical protein